MGTILRSRLLDRCRLAAILLTLIILAFIFGHKHIILASPAHQMSSPSTAHDLAAAISVTKQWTSADASQPQFAQALCRELGLHVFDRKPVPRPGIGSSKRKVYDLFTVHTDLDLDWMQVRLNATYDFVDYFVVAEGRKTSTGLDKPLVLLDNWDRFSAYHDKIIYHELEYPASLEPQRSEDFEDLQRNALFTQAFATLTGEQSPTQGDVLLVADVDELVTPETLLIMRACEIPERLTLHSKLYYYSFQYLHRGLDWPHPQATTYQGLSDTIRPDELRKGGGERNWGYLAPMVRWPEKGDLWNAGWHCTSCFAMADEVVKKMESFSHTPIPVPISLNAPK